MVIPIRRRAALALATATAALLLLAGCTGGSGGNSSAVPKQGGKLVVSTAQGGIPQLDPGAATFQWERVLYPLLWNGLTEVDKSGKVVPGLAAEWSSSPDLMTWTFTLRKGVTFTNGRALAPKDIVWNLQRIVDPKNASLAASYLRPVFKGATESGADQVVVTLSRADSVLPMAISALRIIAPESVSTINTKPVGTGPFTVKSFVPDESLTLVRNKGYWGTKPTLDEIDITASHDSAAAITALRTNDIQVLWNVATADAKPLTQDASVKMLTSDSTTQMQWLALDNSSAPFNNPKARQALAFAMDWKGTVNVAFSGFGQAAVNSEPIPTSSWAFDKSVTTTYKTDLSKAAQLFAEAGVKKGDTLTWWGIAGGYPEWNKEAQLLQQNLAKIGINLSIENNEVGTWVSKFIPRGKKYPGLIIPNAGGDLNDPSFAYDRIAVNEVNYNNPELLKLSDEGRATADEAKRKDIYSQMLKIVSADVPKLYVIHVPMLAAARSTVTGAWVSPAGDLHLEGAGLGE